MNLFLLLTLALVAAISFSSSAQAAEEVLLEEEQRASELERKVHQQPHGSDEPVIERDQVAQPPHQPVIQPDQVQALQRTVEGVVSSGMNQAVETMRRDQVAETPDRKPWDAPEIETITRDGPRQYMNHLHSDPEMAKAQTEAAKHLYDHTGQDEEIAQDSYQSTGLTNDPREPMRVAEETLNLLEEIDRAHGSDRTSRGGRERS